MKVLLTPLGTYGDVAPLVTCAKEMENSGHTITFAITHDFEEYIQSHKFPYIIIPFNFSEFAKRNVSTINKPLRSIFHFKKDICELTNLCWETLKDKIHDFDQIIGSGLQFSASGLAEAANIPYKHMIHAPVWIPSKHHSPPLLRKQFNNSLVNNILWRIFIFLINHILGRTINKQRKQLNLSQVRNIYRRFLENVCLSCNHEFTQELIKISERNCIPYLFPITENHELPDELDTFLQTNKPVAYVGFGSMPLPTTQRTYNKLIELSRILNIRVVFQLNKEDVSFYKSTKNIFVLHNKVDHLKLFRKVSVIVHHGGAGTVHNANRANIPQAIIPFMLDQFYWKKVVMEKLPASEFKLFDLNKFVAQVKSTIL